MLVRDREAIESVVLRIQNSIRVAEMEAFQKANEAAYVAAGRDFRDLRNEIAATFGYRDETMDVVMRGLINGNYGAKPSEANRFRLALTRHGWKEKYDTSTGDAASSRLTVALTTSGKKWADIQEPFFVLSANLAGCESQEVFAKAIDEFLVAIAK